MSRRRGASCVTSRSPIRIRPEVTSSRPASIRSRVVLPQPDGPTRTMNSASAISRSTPSTARTPFPKTFVTCSTVIFAIARAEPLLGVDDEHALLGHLADRVLHALAPEARLLF